MKDTTNDAKKPVNSFDNNELFILNKKKTMTINSERVNINDPTKQTSEKQKIGGNKLSKENQLVYSYLRNTIKTIVDGESQVTKKNQTARVRIRVPQTIKSDSDISASKVKQEKFSFFSEKTRTNPQDMDLNISGNTNHDSSKAELLSSKDGTLKVHSNNSTYNELKGESSVKKKKQMKGIVFPKESPIKNWEEDKIFISNMKNQILNKLSFKAIDNKRLERSIRKLSSNRPISSQSSTKKINIKSISESEKGSSSSDSDKESHEVENEKQEASRKIRRITKVLSNSISEEEILLTNSDDINEGACLILPTSVFKICWDFLLYFLTIYSLLVTPILIAFRDNVNLYDISIDCLMDIFFIADLVIHFFVPFYDFEENLVKSKKLIAMNYFTSWFIWDFLACIPTSSIAGIISYQESLANPNESSAKQSKLYTLNQTARFAKVYRMMKIAQFMKVIKIANKEKRKNMPSLKFIYDLNISSSIKRFCKFFCGFLIISHILSCIWIFFGKLTDFGWIMTFNFLDVPDGELYVNSLYFIWCTIFTIGYGDVTPANTLERVFTVLLMFIGIMIYSFTVSYLGNILTRYDSLTQTYINNIQLLDEIKRKFSIQDSFYDKLAKFLNTNYKLVKGDQFGFINELPTRFRNKLLISIYDDVIKNFKFVKFSNEEFQIKVLMSLKPVRVLKKEYVITENDLIEEFFLVRRGVLTINLPFKYNEQKILEIRRSEHFGDVLILSQYKSPVNVKVATKSADLFTIAKKDLVEISLQFPDIFDKIFWKSTYNYLIMLELMEEKIEKLEIEYLKYEEFTKSLNKVDNSTLSFISNSTLKNSARNPNYKAIFKYQPCIKEWSKKEEQIGPQKTKPPPEQLAGSKTLYSAIDLPRRASYYSPQLHSRKLNSPDNPIINVNFIIQNNNYTSIDKEKKESEISAKAKRNKVADFTSVFQLDEKKNSKKLNNSFTDKPSEESFSQILGEFAEKSISDMKISNTHVVALSKKYSYKGQIQHVNSSKVLRRSNNNQDLVIQLNQLKKKMQRKPNLEMKLETNLEKAESNSPRKILKNFKLLAKSTNNIKTQDIENSNKRLSAFSSFMCGVTAKDDTTSKNSKMETVSQRKGLTKAVMKNFNKQLKQDFQNQSNPASFFRHEFKTMLHNHMDEEVDDQLRKMIEIIKPLAEKFNLNNSILDLLLPQEKIEA